METGVGMSKGSAASRHTARREVMRSPTHGKLLPAALERSRQSINLLATRTSATPATTAPFTALSPTLPRKNAACHSATLQARFWASASCTTLC